MHLYSQVPAAVPARAAALRAGIIFFCKVNRNILCWLV